MKILFTVNYKYDAAGRMVNEGAKNYTYGWLDKVLKVSDNNGVLSEYTYFNSGQLANATHNPVAGDNNAMTNETFVWDGLALIDRNGTSYINEPHAGGGNPVLAISGAGDSQAIFNDMLGTSVGTVSGGGYSAIEKTTFGYNETNNTATADTNFYTGKPNVRNLGYVFLMRNYRSDRSKWQTQDPIGYPDGWNNFAYCNNMSTMAVDLYGCAGTLIIHSSASGDASSTNTSGHAWIEYRSDPTPSNPNPESSTWGTWGNTSEQGLHKDIEKNRGLKSEVQRETHLNDEQEEKLNEKIKEYDDAGEDAWYWVENCSAFATDAWEFATGEDLSGTLWTTPSSLKDYIKEKNGGKTNGVKE